MLVAANEGERAIKWRLNIDASRTKTPRYWGDIDRHVPTKVNIGGTRPPCPIGIDATAFWHVSKRFGTEFLEDWN